MSSCFHLGSVPLSFMLVAAFFWTLLLNFFFEWFIYLYSRLCSFIFLVSSCYILASLPNFWTTAALFQILFDNDYQTEKLLLSKIFLILLLLILVSSIDILDSAPNSFPPYNLGLCFFFLLLSSCCIQTLLIFSSFLQFAGI